MSLHSNLDHYIFIYIYIFRLFLTFAQLCKEPGPGKFMAHTDARSRLFLGTGRVASSDAQPVAYGPKPIFLGSEG